MSVYIDCLVTLYACKILGLYSWVKTKRENRSWSRSIPEISRDRNIKKKKEKKERKAAREKGRSRRKLWPAILCCFLYALCSALCQKSNFIYILTG